MEVKEWSYKEYHSFDKPVDGVTRIPTSGDEKGTYIYSNVEYAHIMVRHCICRLSHHRQES